MRNFFPNKIPQIALTTKSQNCFVSKFVKDFGKDFFAQNVGEQYLLIKFFEDFDDENMCSIFSKRAQS